MPDNTGKTKQEKIPPPQKKKADPSPVTLIFFLNFSMISGTYIERVYWSLNSNFFLYLTFSRAEVWAWKELHFIKSSDSGGMVSSGHLTAILFATVLVRVCAFGVFWMCCVFWGGARFALCLLFFKIFNDLKFKIFKHLKFKLYKNFTTLFIYPVLGFLSC